MTSLDTVYSATLNRVAKWRNVFAGWQLGTRSDTDPEAKAVKDQREALILMRIEVTAMVALMIEKNVFTEQEFKASMIREADFLDKVFEKAFPGFSVADYGVKMTMPEAGETMRNWRP